MNDLLESLKKAYVTKHSCSQDMLFESLIDCVTDIKEMQTDEQYMHKDLYFANLHYCACTIMQLLALKPDMLEILARKLYIAYTEANSTENYYKVTQPPTKWEDLSKEAKEIWLNIAQYTLQSQNNKDANNT